MSQTRENEFELPRWVWVCTSIYYVAYAQRDHDQQHTVYHGLKCLIGICWPFSISYVSVNHTFESILRESEAHKTSYLFLGS